MIETIETIEANWLVFGAALAAALLVTWWLLRRASKPAPRAYRPDVLDEGQAPAQRNQALIDAPPAAQFVSPLPASGAMAGVGEIVAVAAQVVVEEVEAREPEAAPPPPPPPEPEVVPAPEPAPVPAPMPETEPSPVPAPAPVPLPEIEPAFEPLSVPDAPTAEAALAPDDLARIKGLGPKLQALLPELGITTFAQIAALTEADIADLDPKLGPFAGRPVRDSWVEQAQYLAAGDVAGFEAKYGKV